MTSLLKERKRSPKNAHVLAGAGFWSWFGAKSLLANFVSGASIVSWACKYGLARNEKSDISEGIALHWLLAQTNAGPSISCTTGSLMEERFERLM